MEYNLTHLQESDTRNGGAMRPHVYLGGDYFVVLYSGNNFKFVRVFLLLYVHIITGAVQPLSVSYKRNHTGGGMRIFKISS